MEKVTVDRNQLVAELKLQSCEKANIFYATDITLDSNIPQGDYSLMGKWQAAEFTHKNKSEEDEISVNGKSTIIQGVIKDLIGQQNSVNMQYMVTICLWVELEDELKTECIQTDNK
jgi:hypothetical protein